MIKFNELSISPNNQHFTIDISVQNLDYYKNIYIDSIFIDTQDTYVENGPSSQPVYIYQAPEVEYNNIYSIPEDCSCNQIKEEATDSDCFTKVNGVKNLRLDLTSIDIPVSFIDNMFFVYIVAKGVPAPNTPCSLDNKTTLAVVVNLLNYYNRSINLMNQVLSECNIPKEFIDNILRFKALQLAINTGHYTLAIKYWNKFFKKNNVISPVKNCGCNEQS